MDHPPPPNAWLYFKVLLPCLARSPGISHAPSSGRSSLKPMSGEVPEPCALGRIVCCHKAEGGRRGVAAGVDGEVERGQEVISLDKRPYGAVKTSGLGPRKLELKLGPTPLQPCDPVQVSSSLGSEPANISMFIPTGICSDIPSLPPPTSPGGIQVEVGVILHCILQLDSEGQPD